MPVSIISRFQGALGKMFSEGPFVGSAFLESAHQAYQREGLLSVPSLLMGAACMYTASTREQAVTPESGGSQG